jgi:alpha-glucosidase
VNQQGERHEWRHTGRIGVDGAVLVIDGSPVCRVTGRADGSVRVGWDTGPDYYETVVAPVLDRAPEEPVPWTLDAASGAAAATAGSVRVTVREDTLVVRQDDTSWHLRLARQDSAWTLEVALDPDEGVYGLGEKMGPLDHRGRRWVQWASDVAPHVPSADPLYQAIPFALLAGPRGARGLLVADVGRTVFDARRSGQLVVGVEQGAVVAELLPGPHPTRVLDLYTRLTGRPALPPVFALGVHQSRWGYRSADEVRSVVEGYRARDIPLDAVFLDIDYMDEYRLFTWDPVRFPDPQGLTAELTQRRVRLVPIIDVGVKVDATYPVYQQGRQGGHFLVNPAGGVFTGQVWPGEAAFPDFARSATRDWWADLNRALAERGVGGIWNDMNEPALWDAQQRLVREPEAWHRLDDGRMVPNAAIHNAYALLEARATYEGLRAAHTPPRRPFILTRSGFAGIQRYAAVWTGDNQSWWEQMAQSVPTCLNLALSGVALVGADVGGFSDVPTPELMARWIALGSFLPYFRIHSDNVSPAQEPWRFGALVEDVARQFMGRRYRLLPYWVSLFAEAAATGTPPLRPLFWHFPDQAEAFTLGDQFLIGPFLLVAPVLQPGVRHRAVYLPKGRWWDVEARRWRDGPGWHVADADERQLPRYWRSGAVIPVVHQPLDSTEAWGRRWGTGQDGPDGFVLVAGTGEFTVYTDDGDTFAYADGDWRRIAVTLCTDGDGWPTARFQHHVGRPGVADLDTMWTVTVGPLPAQPVQVEAGMEGGQVQAVTPVRQADTADGWWWAVRIPVRLRDGDTFRLRFRPA